MSLMCEWCASSIEDEGYEDGGFTYCSEDCMGLDIRANRPDTPPTHQEGQERFSWGVNKTLVSYIKDSSINQHYMVLGDETHMECLVDLLNELAVPKPDSVVISRECATGAVISLNAKSHHTNVENKARLRKFVVELKLALEE